MTSKIMPRLSISDSRSAAWSFHSGVSRTRNLPSPPVPFCARCGGTTEPAEVSGRATVYSYTVNHQAWDGTTEPYVIGLVAIDEQPDVRLTTNIVDCDPGDVRIGMPVQVVFADHDPIYLPLFRPVTPGVGL